MTKQLHRKKENAKVSGVCIGIAHYFNIDPSIVRLIWAFFALNGSGVLVYVLCSLIIPIDE